MLNPLVLFGDREFHICRNSLSSGPCLRVCTAGCTYPSLRLGKAKERRLREGKAGWPRWREAGSSPGWLQPQARRLNSGRNAIYRLHAAPTSTRTLKVAPPPPPEPNIREKNSEPSPRNPNLARTWHWFHTTFCLPTDVSSFSEQLCKGQGGGGCGSGKEDWGAKLSGPLIRPHCLKQSVHQITCI